MRIHLDIEGAQVGRDDSNNPVVFVGFSPVPMSPGAYSSLVAGSGGLRVEAEIITGKDKK